MAAIVCERQSPIYDNTSTNDSDAVNPLIPIKQHDACQNGLHNDNNCNQSGGYTSSIRVFNSNLNLLQTPTRKRSFPTNPNHQTTKSSSSLRTTFGLGQLVKRHKFNLDQENGDGSGDDPELMRRFSKIRMCVSPRGEENIVSSSQVSSSHLPKSCTKNAQVYMTVEQAFLYIQQQLINQEKALKEEYDSALKLRMNEQYHNFLVFNRSHQAKFRPGNTYGMTSHRVLIDPCIHMSPRSILNNIHPEYCTDDFGRPGVGADPLLNAQMALVNTRVNSFGRQQYQSEMTPGYTGYIPRFQTILGHTYSPACNRALARFETDQWRDRLFNKELEALDGWRFCYKNKPWETPEVIRSGVGDLQEFARSPCCQQQGRVSADDFGRQATGSYGPEPEFETGRRSTSSGGCGCERTVEFTILNKERPSCDFADRRMFGCATEQILKKTVGDIIPQLNAFRISRPPAERIQEIYRGCEGLMPEYSGHVPGNQFRIGRSFACSSRNAKRAIEPVYHKPLCYPPVFKR